MQPRRYEARTINDAFRRIKAELGDDAVILSTKTIKKPDDGRCAERCWIEVTAAIDCQPNKQLQIVRNNCKMPNDFRTPLAARGSTSGALSENRDHSTAERTNERGVRGTKYAPYLHSLVHAGFRAETAWYLIGEAYAAQAQGHGAGSFYNALIARIGEHLPIAGGIALDEKSQKIVALIGTTGVGKTTTLAKLAAQCAANRRLKVRIITLDTLRIAAVEQLKVYAGIMKIPISVATSIDELNCALSACNDSNVVLIDTAGRSHHDTQRVYELSTWLNTNDKIEPHLVVSSTTSPGLGEAIMKCFRCTRFNRLILTKLDESITIGHLFDTIIDENIPISYVTTGQRVPEDLQGATGQYLAKLFLNGYGNS